MKSQERLAPSSGPEDGAPSARPWACRARDGMDQHHDRQTRPSDASPLQAQLSQLASRSQTSFNGIDCCMTNSINIEPLSHKRDRLLMQVGGAHERGGTGPALVLPLVFTACGAIFAFAEATVRRADEDLAGQTCQGTGPLPSDCVSTGASCATLSATAPDGCTS